MDDRDGVEPQERRPPLYNPEDYVLGLKKFSKLTGLQLYLGEMEIGANNKAEQGQTNNHNGNNNNSSNNSINNNNNHNRKNKKNRSRNNAADDNLSEFAHLLKTLAPRSRSDVIAAHQVYIYLWALTF